LQLQHRAHLDALQKLADKSADEEDVRTFVHGPYPATVKGRTIPASQ
jgi:hypothetical protein